MTTMQITILIFGVILSGIAVFLYCLKNAALDPEEPHTVDLLSDPSETWFKIVMAIAAVLLIGSLGYIVYSLLNQIG